jgi:putative sporulation protein YyaC
MKAGVRRRWKRDREIYYFDSERETDVRECARLLQALICEVMQETAKKKVLMLCIGTDRSTGDSLGPLIGYKLKMQQRRYFPVIGTLERPVHAMNLEQAVDMVQSCYPDYVIVAVDASVGSQEHVGCITMGKGALRPGLGVSKNLQAVGDIFITGIVGSYGNYDPEMLQSVRLSVVMRMADYIAESVHLVEHFFDRRALV